MSPLRVLIVGASIAGPTAAYWFSRAGCTVTVIERFPNLRLNGQGIDIRTAGVTVMRRIPGMEAAVRAKTTTLEGLSFVDTHGKSYGTLGATGDPDQQSLVSEYEIFRGDLAKILYDLSEGMEGVRYVFGEQVVGMRQGEKEDGPVWVEFANGKVQDGEYDLVVACDGATSRTRAIGLGCGVRDYIEPVNAWAAYFSLDGDRMGGKKIGQAHTTVGGRFIALGPDPAGITRATLMSIHPRRDNTALIPFREASKQSDDNDALKKYVASRYEGTGWRTPEILTGMLSAKDFYASEVVQVKLPTLHKGRFVLVGDAGYAPGPTGGGTTLALAGAYILAGEICKHGAHNIVAGLAGYESTMRPLISDMQKIPPGVPGIMAPQTESGIFVRNWIFAALCWSRVHELAGKWFGAAFAETGRYELEEYPWVR